MTVGRALITGAGGFVGSALAGGFLRLGWQVCALDTTFDVPARARLSEAELVCADLGGPLPELSRADVIIHAAALTTGPEALGITPASLAAVVPGYLSPGQQCARLDAWRARHR